MLQLSGAGKRFGPRLLFENADWLITPNERTALVGANGAGKSTLMKILGGMDSLDYGTMQRMRGMSIGYLPQDGLTLSGRTVFDECLSVFDQLRAMEREFEALSASLAELDPASQEYATVADRYSHVEGRLRHHNVYALDAEVGTVLTGLGFAKEDWTRRTEEFSGGWQMRVALAKLLLEQPDLLLLDEPTNHLDLETRNWLENYLSTWPNGYILISHDRYFLDVTVNKIIEIWNKALHVYHGNYEKYLTQKAERRAQLEAAYKNQRDRIEHLEVFINRFRYQATRAKQVQSRIKELEKIERIEIPLEEPTPHFSFPQPPPSGRNVVEVAGMSMQYGEKRVLENVNFTIERGDRIALVGVNGAGKSTLIRLLSGQESPAAGTLKLGHNVIAEYFAQDQYKVLDPVARMLDDIGRTAAKVAEKDLRSLLGCFLFSGDDVFKQLGVLSGGERNRYALARILVSPANFLLLDEPTNHLDLRAKDVLLEAIGKFNGTVIFVSHDRYFIDGLAQKVFEVARSEDPARGSQVHVFPGNYEDYLWRKEGGAAELAAETAAAAAPVVEAPAPVAEPEAAQAHAKRVNPIKLRQMQERLAQVEAEIPRVDGWVAETEQALSVYVSAEETQRLTEVLAVLRDRQAELNSEWEELSLQLQGQETAG
ncbi:MAG TPA: ABC-F family ATP-binding cassette domain-containing protein [Acidobacteriaceae bacterium]